MILAKFYFPDGSTTINHGVSYVRSLNGLQHRGSRPTKVVFTGTYSTKREYEVFKIMVSSFVPTIMHPQYYVVETSGVVHGQI